MSRVAMQQVWALHELCPLAPLSLLIVVLVSPLPFQSPSPSLFLMDPSTHLVYERPCVAPWHPLQENDLAHVAQLLHLAHAVQPARACTWLASVDRRSTAPGPALPVLRAEGPDPLRSQPHISRCMLMLMPSSFTELGMELHP